MLLSTGERISCALCAMAIHDLGQDAISLSGSQAGIVTDTSHTKARIMEVKADRIRELLDDGKVVLVAGFQGVSTTRDVTTLGRGGSDTTAVALAAALGADVCQIYTDVDGVFSADPRIVPDARKLSGAVVRGDAGDGRLGRTRVAAALGRVRAQLRRADKRQAAPLDDGSGTLVTSEEQTMERPLVTAVTHSTDEARLTLVGVPDRPGVAGEIFNALAEADVNVDMIIQNEPVSDRKAEVSFTVPRDDLRRAGQAMEKLGADIGADEVIANERIGKVSIVGAGMRSHPGVAAKVFSVLGEKQINIEMISTSPIKISCAIDADSVPDAVRALHSAFELGSDAIEPEGGPR